MLIRLRAVSLIILSVRLIAVNSLVYRCIYLFISRFWHVCVLTLDYGENLRSSQELWINIMFASRVRYAKKTIVTGAACADIY